MAIALKLVAEEIDERMVQTLKLIRDNNNSNTVNVATANKEGFTIEEATYERIKNLVLLFLLFFAGAKI